VTEIDGQCLECLDIRRMEAKLDGVAKLRMLQETSLPAVRR